MLLRLIADDSLLSENQQRLPYRRSTDLKFFTNGAFQNRISGTKFTGSDKITDVLRYLKAISLSNFVHGRLDDKDFKEHILAIVDIECKLP